METIVCGCGTVVRAEEEYKVSLDVWVNRSDSHIALNVKRVCGTCYNKLLAVLQHKEGNK